MNARNAGTRLHQYAEEFAATRRPALADNIEQAFLGGTPIGRYRAPGSSVPDVVTGTLNNPTAVFDFKFGQQGITSVWEARLRSNLPNGSIPIQEIRPYTGPYQRLTGAGTAYNIFSEVYAK